MANPLSKKRGVGVLIPFLLLLSFLLPLDAFAQPVPTTARHETINQNIIEVTFDQNITFSTGATGWSVDIDSNPVVVVAAFLSGADRIQVQFATPVDFNNTLVEISYDGSGDVQSNPGGMMVVAFGPLTSENNHALACSDWSFVSVGEVDPLNVDVCAPVVPTRFFQYNISAVARNSTNFLIGRFRIFVNWGDPATTVLEYLTFEADLAGNPQLGTRLLRAEPTGFSYPANDPNCTYDAIFFPSIVGVGTCPIGGLVQGATFVSYDTDNESTGALQMNPTVANSDEVCLGDNANMTFSDNTDLNCRLAVEPDSPNQGTRWIRFVYGDAGRADIDRIPNIEVGGVAVTDGTGALIGGEYFPTGVGGVGTPDFNGVIELASPVTAPTELTQLITTSSTTGQIVGQQFHVRMEYWNVCNPYNPGFNLGDAVSITEFIEIIPSPADPIPGDVVACQGGAIAADISVTAVTPGATLFNFYDENPDLGAAVLLQSSASNTYTHGIPSTVPIVEDFFVTQVNGATNSCESVPVEVTVTVKEELTVTPPITSSDPAQICEGTTNITYSLGAAAATETIGGATEYQWSLPAGWTFNSATNLQTIDVNAPVGASSGNISVVRQYTTGLACTSAAVTFAVTVDPIPIVTPGLTQTVCSDVAASLTLTTTPNVASTTFTWGLPTVDAGLIGVGTTGPGTVITDAFTNPTNGPLNVTYSVTPTGPGPTNCVGTPVNVVLTIDPEPVLDPGLDATVCSDAVSGITLNDNGSSVNAATFNITSIVNNGLTASAGSPATGTGFADSEIADDAWTNTTAADVDVVYTVVPVSAAGCVGDPVAVTLTVEPEPVLDPGLDATVCSDAASGITLDDNGSSVNANTFNITNINNGGLTASAGGPATGTGFADSEIADDAWTNTGSSNVNVVYTVVPVSAAGCLGDPVNVTLTVRPEPVLDPGLDATVCSDVVSGITLDDNGSSVNAATFNITNINNNGLVASAGGPATGTGFADSEIADDAWTNTGAANVDVIYTIVPVSAAGCLGDAVTVTLTVQPEPVLDPGLDDTTCSDVASGITLDDNGSSVNAATFNITNINNGGLTASAGSPATGTGFADSEIADDAWTNTTLASVNVVYTVVPVSAAGCLGDPVDVTLTVDPEPILVATNNLTSVCSGGNTDIDLSSTLAGSLVTWTVVESSPMGATNQVAPLAMPLNLSQTLTNGTLFPQTATYTIVPQSAAGCIGTQQVVVVTVSAAAPSAAPTPNTFPTVCQGDNNVTFSVNAVAGATEYDWDVSAVAGASIVSTAPFGTSIVVNFTAGATSGNFVVRGENGCGQGPPLNQAVTVNGTPVLDPALDATVCSDIASGITLVDDGIAEPATTFNITAINNNGLTASAGGPATGTGFAANEIIDDAWTNTSMSPVNVVYTVRPVSALGCVGPAVDVTLTVNPEPVLDPGLDATVCSDIVSGITLNDNGASVNAATFNITAINNNGLVASAGAPATGTGFADSEIADDAWTNTGAANVNVIYTVVPVSAAGCLGDAVNVTLTVQPEPVLDPALDATVCSDVASGVTLNDNGASVNAATFNITAINNNGLVASAGAPATGTGFADSEIADDAWTNTGAADVDVIYTIVPVSAAGCLGDAVNVTLTVQPEPVLDPGLDATVCSDIVSGITLNDNGASVNAATFNITAINNNGLVASAGAPATGTGFADSEIADDAWTNPGAADVDVIYTIVPVSAAGCLGDAVNVTLTVQPEPVLDPGLDATVCSDIVSGITLNDNGASVNAATFNITAINNNGLVASAGAPATGVGFADSEIADDAWTNTGAANVNVIYTVVPVSAAGCLGDAVNVTLTVQPEPVLDPALDATVCSDVASGITLNDNGASVNAATFNITAINNNGLVASAGAPATGVGFADSEIADDAWTNTGAADVDVIYTVIPVSAAGCLGEAVNVTLTVQPEPVLDPGLDATVCSDIASGITLNDNGASVNAATFNITAINNNGLVASAGAPATGTGFADSEIADDAWTNPGAADVDVIYTVIPVSAAGCLGDAVNVTLTVQPEPVLDPGLDATVCSDVASGITLDDNGASINAATFNITAINNNGLVASAGAPATGVGFADSEIADDAWTNTGAVNVDVIYTVVPVSAGGCLGDAVNVTLTVQPEPVLDPGLDVTVCSDLASGITLNDDGASVNAATFNITNINNNGLVATAGAPATGTGFADSEIADDAWRNNGTVAVDVEYTIVPVSAAGCLGDAVVVTVTVDPGPVLDPLLDATLCSDVASGITLDDDGSSVNAATFNITAINNNGLTASAGAPATGTGFTDSEIADDAWTNTTTLPVDVDYTIVPVSAAGCVGDPVVVTLTINPEPILDPGLDATQCSDIASGITLADNGASVAAISYNIIAINNNGLVASAGAPATGTGFSNLEIADDAWTNTTMNPVDVIYTVIPVSALGCLGDAVNVTFTVDPEPVLDPGLDVLVCSDDPTGIVLDDDGVSVNAATFNITAINPNGLTASAGAPTTGNGFLANEIADDAWTNGTAASVNVVYTIVPVSAIGCLGDAVNVTATINPAPDVIATNNSPTICSGDPTDIDLTSNVAGTTFTWTVVPGPNIAGAADEPVPQADPTTIAQTLTNSGTTPETVTYSIVPTGCLVGAPSIVVVTVNPTPVTTAITGGNSITAGVDNVCVGSTYVYEVDPPAGTALSTYAWTVNPALDAPTVTMVNNRVILDFSANAWVGTLQVIESSNYGGPVTCDGAAQVITINSFSEPVADAGPDDTICEGAGTVIGATPPVTGGSGTFTYSWTPTTGLDDPTLANPTASPTATTTYTLVVTDVISGCVSAINATAQMTVTVDPKPILDPSLTETVCSDVAANLQLQVTGPSVAAVSYSWPLPTVPPQLVGVGTAGVNEPDPAFITDAFTNPTNLPLDVVYMVTPRSAAGCDGDPVAVTITVDPEPVIDPNLDATVCSDVVSGITLATDGASVAAASYNITAINQNGLVASAGAPATGTGFGVNEISDDAFTNTTMNPVDVVYTVVPVSAAGCLGDALNITLTVDPEPVLSGALDATQCSDVASGITLADNGASVAAATFNITTINMNGLTASAGAPVTGNGFAANEIADDAYTNTTMNPVDVIYTVVPVSAAGCLGDPLNVTFTVDPEPVLDANLDATVCSDQASGITLSDDGIAVGATTFNITAINFNGLVASAGAPATGNGLAANEIIDDAYTNISTVSVDVVYTVVPVSAAGCEGDPVDVRLTVRPEPVLNAGLDATVCSDQASGIVLDDDGVNIAASTFNITAINNNGLVASAGAPVVANGVNANEIADDAWTNISAAPVDVIYTIAPVSINGCVGDPVNVTLTVDPEPVLNAGLDATVCSDVASGITLADDGVNVAAATYNITAINFNGLTASAGSPATGAGLAANVIADDAYTNNSMASVNVVYTIVPVSAAGCEGDPLNVTLTVDPEPVLSNTLDATVCSDIASGITLADNGLSEPAVLYNITAINNNGLVASAGAPATGNNLAANEIIDDAWTNVSAAPVDVIYTVVPISAGGCLGDPMNVTLTVNPEPVMDPALDATVCSDVASGITLASDGVNVAAALFNITAINPNGLVASAGAPATGNNLPASEISDDAWTNVSAAPVDVVYTVEPVSADGCIGTALDVTLTVDPEPALSAALDATVCSDTPSGITLTDNGATVAAATFNITAINNNGLTASAGAPATGVGFLAAEISDDAYTNTGASPVNVIYTVVPVSAAGCVGDPLNVTLTIDPEPVLSAGLDATVCSDVATGVTLSDNGASVGAALFNITAINPNGLVASAGAPATGNNLAANEIADDAWTNISAAPVDVIYTIQPVSAAGCIGDAVNVTITIDPEPAMNAGLDATTCSDVASGITLADDGVAVGAATFNITAINNNGLTASAGNPVLGVGFAANEIIDDAWTNVSAAPVDVIYTVVPVSAAGCAGDALNVTLTVDPEPALSAALDATVCSDTPSGITLADDGVAVGAALFNITAINNNGLVASAGAPATGNNLPANEIADDAWTNTGFVPVNVVYTVEPVSAAGCIGDPLNVTLTIDPEPVLSATLDVTVCSDVATGVTLDDNGASVNAALFNITAINPNGLVASAGAPATGNNLPATEISDDAWTNISAASVDVIYTVQPVSAAGCIGDAVNVTVTIDPEPAMNAGLDATVCSDLPSGITLADDGVAVGAATFNITAINNNGLTASAGNPVLGSGFAANEIIDDAWTNISAAPVDVIYTVVPVSAAGCVGDPLNVTLTVDPEPALSAALDATVCSDTPSGITLADDGIAVGATLFNITAINNNGLVASAGAPATGNNLPANEIADDAWTNTGVTSVNVVYTVEPISAAGCIGDPLNVTLTIDPEPILSGTLDATVCSDVATGVTLSDNGATVAATLFNITAINPNGLVASAGAPVTGNNLPANEISDDAWTNISAAPVNVVYTVQPVSAAGCIGDPVDVTITIDPEPAMNAGLDATTCSDVASGITLADDGVAVGAASFNITAINNNGLTASAGNPALGVGFTAAEIVDDAWTNISAAPVNVIYTVVPVSAAGCLGDPLDITLTVDPEPALSAALDATVCSDTPSGITLADDGVAVGATLFNITAINNNGLVASAGAPATGNNLPPNEIADDAWTNTGFIPVSVVYTIEPVSAAGCIGDPLNVTLTIDPEPVLSATLDVTVCSDIATGVTLDDNGASVNATLFNITAINPNGLVASAGAPATGNNLPASEISDDAWTNISAAPVNVVYTVQPVSAAGCIGDPVDVTITVDPEPAMNAGLDATVCSDIASGITLADDGVAVAAATFNITAINNNGLTASAGNPVIGIGFAANEIIDDAWTNISAAPVDVVYTVVPVSAAGCLGDPLDVTLTVDPEPAMSAALNATVCSDIASGITLADDGVAVAAALFNITAINANGLVASAGAPVTGNNLPANEIADDAWTNTGFVSVNVVYTVEPISAAGCIGDPLDITLTVDPEPILNPALDATVCSDLPSGINLSGNGTSAIAATFNITAINNNGLVASAGAPATGTGFAANEISDDAWTNTTPLPVDVIYTIQPVTAGGCIGDAVNVTLTVDPEPILNAGLDATTCSDVASGITLADDGVGVAAATYNITAINNNGLAPSAGSPTPGTGFGANEIIDDAWTNTTPLPVDVIYTVVPVSAAGCAGDPVDVTLTVDPEPTLDPSLSTTVCSDIASGITLADDGIGVGATLFNITAINNNGLVASAGAPVTGNNLPANEIVDDAWTNTGFVPVQVTYTVEPVSAAGCIGNPVNVILTVNPEPVLSPTLDATVCSDVATNVFLTGDGASAIATAFNITAINNNGLVASAGAPVTGNNLPSTEISDDAWTNTTALPVDVVYTIQPVSAAGCIGDPVDVTITVDPEPVLNAGLDATVCSDIASGITLADDGLGVAAATYNINAINNNGLIASAGAPTPGVGFAANEIIDDAWTNTTPLPVDVIYTVVPVSAAGCLGDPVDITLTVDPEPILDPALSTTICSDVASGITLADDGIGVAATVFNITAINNNGLVASAGAPATGNNLPANEIADDAWTNTGFVPVVVTYTVEPVSAAGCIGDPVSIFLTVNPEPVLNPGLDATVCSDTPSAINLSGDGLSVAASTFNITAINNNGLVASAGAPATGNGLPASEIADDAWTNTSMVPVDVIYTVVPVSAAGCEGDPVDVTLTVDPEPILSGALDATVCSDVVTGVTLTDNGVSVAAATFNITAINNNGLSASAGGPTPGTGFAANVIADDAWTNASAAPVDVVYTIVPVSAAGCLGDPLDVTITIDPEPVLDPALSTTVCSDLPSGITLADDAIAIGAVSFNITAINNGGLTASAGAPATGNGLPANEIVDDAWTNTGFIPVNVVYTVVPVSAAGCEGDPVNVTLTVDPEPVLNPGLDATVCSDALSNIILSGDGASVTAATFNITAINNNGLVASAGAPVVANGVASNEIADDAWTNASAAPVDVIYTVVPVSAGGCEGDAVNVTLTVDPEPVLDPALDATVCSDVATGVMLSDDGIAVAATTFNITAINPNGLIASAGSPNVGNGLAANVIADDAWTNTSMLPVDVTYTVVPISAIGCEGDPVIVTITIDPEPVLDPNLNATVCSDLPAGIMLSDNGASVAAATFNITAINNNGLTASAGGPIVASGVAANEISDDAWTNTGANPVNVTYTIEPVSAAGCIGNPVDVILTVNPEPVLNPALDATVCSDNISGITLSSDGVSTFATSFNITSIISSGLVASAGAPATGNGLNASEIFDDAWTNTGAIPVDVLYTVVPVSSLGCEGDAVIVRLTVDPEPVLSGALDATACSDVAIGVTLASDGASVPATTFNITAINSNGLISSAGTPGVASGVLAAEISDDAWTNTTMNPVDVVYTVVPISAIGCVGDPLDVTVTIDPEPAGGNDTDEICSDVALSYDLQNNINTFGNGLVSDFSWVAADNLNVTGESLVPQAGAFINDVITNVTGTDEVVVYTVTPTDQANNCVGDPFQVSVTVKALPMVDAGLPQTVCEGSSVSLGTGAGAAISGTFTNILWDDNGAGGSFSNPTALNAVYFPGTGVTGAVTLTLEISDGGGLCPTVSDDVIITINPEITVDAGPAQVICEDGTANLTATVGGSFTDLMWTIVSGGAGSFGNPISPTTTFTPDPGVTGVFSLRLTATDATAICPDQFDDVIITVNANPIVGIVNDDADDTICDGDQVIFTAFGAQNYEFFVNGISVQGPSLSNTFTTTTLADGDIVSVEGEATTTCKNTIAHAAMTVNPLPPVTLVSSDADNTICENDMVTFTAAGAVNYEFFLNGVPVQGPGPTDTYVTSSLADGDIVSVTGTDGNTCNFTPAGITTTVIAAPTVVLSSSDADNVICAGDAVTFTATSPTGTNYEFFVDGISAQNSASDQFTTSALTNGQSVNVIVTNVSGCTITSTNITTTVNDLPTATIAGTTSICNGGFTTLIFEMTGRLPFDIQYTDGTNTFTETGVATVHAVTVNPTTNTTYSLVSVTDANGCVETTLPGTAVITVEDAVASFSTTQATQDCSPYTVDFTNDDIRPGITYVWIWGDGSPNDTTTIADPATITHTFENNSTTIPLTYNATLIATNDALGCSDNMSIPIEVFPSIFVDVEPDVTEGCGPLQVSFENRTLGATNHLWFYRPQGTTQQNEIETIPFVTYNLPNTGTTDIVYEVVYRGSKGSCFEEEITPITVYPELNPSFTVAPDDTVLITQTPHVTITNTTPNASAWDYQWDMGDGSPIITSQNPPAYTYATFGVYTITLTITNPAHPECTAVSAFTIVVEPVVPEVDFSFDVTEGCRPVVVTFTNESFSADPDTYFWEFRAQTGAVIGTSREENPVFTFFDPGVYTVSLEGSNALGITDNETKEAIIEVFDLPVAAYVVRPTTVFLPDQAIFTDNLTSGADTYFWDFGDGVTSEDFEPSHTYEEIGTYTITLIATSINGCTDTLAKEKEVQVLEGGNTRVPNAFTPSLDGPSGGSAGNGTFNDVFLPVTEGVTEFNMQIFDRWGNLIFESNDKNIGWDGYSKNGKLLPSGVYVFKLNMKLANGERVTRIGDVTLIR